MTLDWFSSHPPCTPAPLHPCTSSPHPPLHPVYRRCHQRITAVPNAIKGTRATVKLKILACCVVKLIRRFFASLGRIESSCLSCLVSQPIELRNTSPFSCCSNTPSVANVEFPTTTSLDSFPLAADFSGFDNVTLRLRAAPN